MKNLRYVICIVIVLLTAVATQAQDEDPRTPIMTLGTLEPHPIGTRVTVDVTIKNSEGRLLPNLPLVLYIDGEQVRRARTGEEGTTEVGRASIRISEDLEIGTHDITVEFIGTEAYNPVIQNTTVIVRPIYVEVQTVPSLPNIEFLLGGNKIVSGEDGVAHAELLKPGTYPLEALPLEDDYVDEDTRAEFQRWSDSTFTPDRTLEVRGDEYVEAGYIISHRVGQVFHDLQGEPVEYSRITSITLKTSTGDYYTFEDGQPRWLQATRINRSREGLEVTQIQYSVESVMIDGSNVVNQYQQRFFVQPNDTWDIELLMYFAILRAKDALFGFTVGEGINVEYPSGEIVFHPYTEDKVVEIGPLARGTYKVQASGVGGMVPITPVALSKDQDVHLKVMTTLDIATFLATGIIGALGLLFIGRPFLLTLPFRMVSTLRERIRTPFPLPVPLPAAISNGDGGRLATGVATSNGYLLQERNDDSRVGAKQFPIAEKRLLRQLKASTLDEKIGERAEVILLTFKGLSPEEITEKVDYSLKSVNRYIKRYEEEGIAGLFNRPIRTDLSTVGNDYLELLHTVIQEHPSQVNFRYENWTANRLSLYLAAHTGIYVDVAEMDRYLSEIGWYGDDGMTQDTEPVLPVVSDEETVDEPASTSIFFEEEDDETVQAPMMASDDFDETEPTDTLIGDDEDTVAATLNENAETSLDDDIRHIPYHLEFIEGNSSSEQQEAKAKTKRLG